MGRGEQSLDGTAVPRRDGIAAVEVMAGTIVPGKHAHAPEPDDGKEGGQRLALDLDSTIYPLLDGMRRVPGGERVRYEDCHSWGTLFELCDGDYRKVLHGAWEPEVAIAVGAFPGALPVLRRLHAAGVYIEVMTARPEKMRGATQEYLDALGVPHDELTLIEGEEKPGRCLERGIEVIVDDSPDTLLAARERGLRALGLEHRYNRHVADHGVILRPSWRQLEEPLCAALGLDPAQALTSAGAP